MQMSARIHDGDLIYCAWWALLVGTVIYLLARIERNTRNKGSWRKSVL